MPTMSTPTTDLRTVHAASTVRKVSPVVIVAAVLGCVFIGTAALVATLYAPKGHDSAVVVSFVIGTIAPTVVALLALIRGDHAVQVGETNALRLVATASKVEQVAKDVNGHLTRHDALAQAVTTVAETVAAASGVAVQMPRDPETRTRSTDPGGPVDADTSAPVTDTAPLGPQT